MAEEEEADGALLVTDFAGPALREACQQAGVSYVDESGWLYLRNDNTGMLIRLEGNVRNSPSRHRESIMRRLDGPGAGAVIRTLWDTTPPCGVRSLAQNARVSPGTSAKVLPELAQYGAIERGERGEILTVDRRILLDRWVQDYKIYESNSEVSWFLSARGPEMAHAETLKIQAQDSNLHLSFTGYLAALNNLPENIYPVIPNTLLSLYSPDPEDLASKLRLRSVDRHRANVVIVRPKDESLVKTGSSYVPLPQVLADLMTMGGRFPELAEQILEYDTYDATI